MILRIMTRIVVWIFMIYLVLGFVLIPLALVWVVPSQGTKILKHPVHLRSVGFNPFLLKLNMKGFEILDHSNQVMVGFDQLMVQVSFKDLLKKIYHVELFELDGLRMNIELLAGNQINLLDLAPPGVLPAAGHSNIQAPKNGPNQAKAATATPIVLPKVLIDSIVLHQGQIHFIDKTIKPNFVTTLSGIEFNITHISTDPETQAKIKFRANLDEKGLITMETLVKPLAQPIEAQTTFSLNDYALSVLTPYVGKFTGRELRSGKLDLTMDYHIGGNKLTASHKLLIQRFAFGSSVESKDALHLPFGLAVALLEDSEGKISIALPVTGDMSDPKFEYSHLIVQVVRNFFINLITKPFSFLASTLGASNIGVDELGYVRFTPGQAELSDSQKQKLITLIKGLKQHPKLHLEIDGSYDPKTDWKAIQKDSFSKEYGQLRKISDWPDGKLYQLLYQRHFGIRALWALAKKYKRGIGDYNDAKLDQEIKRQLIENAPPDVGALSALAQTRAELVHDFFINRGFDAQRLSFGHPQETQSSMGYVPLSFTLTVFDK